MRKQDESRRFGKQATKLLFALRVSWGYIEIDAVPCNKSAREARVESFGATTNAGLLLKAALLAIQTEISDPQMSMLRAHYYHRTLTMESIANFGGYGEYQAGNLQCGLLCGRLARQLRFDPAEDIDMYIVGSFRQDHVSRIAASTLDRLEPRGVRANMPRRRKPSKQRRFR